MAYLKETSEEREQKVREAKPQRWNSKIEEKAVLRIFQISGRELCRGKMISSFCVIDNFQLRGLPNNKAKKTDITLPVRGRIQYC